MNDLIFWQCQAGGLVCMNAQTGATVWADSTNFGATFNNNMTGHEGKIFLESAGKLVCVSAGSGIILWTKTSINPLDGVSMPIIGNGIIVATTNTLYKLNTTNGSEIWSSTIAPLSLLLIPDGSKLLVATKNPAAVYAYDPNLGNVINALQLSDAASIPGNMAFANNTLIVSTLFNFADSSQKYYCVNYTLQTESWVKKNYGYSGVESTSYAPPVLFDTLVIMSSRNAPGTNEQQVRALGLSTGNIVWTKAARYPSAGVTPISPALDGKVFYENDGADSTVATGFVCANVHTGNMIWVGDPSPASSTTTWGSLLVYDNKLYAASDKAGLYCFDAGTISGKWHMYGANIYGTNSYDPALIPAAINDPDLSELRLSTYSYPNPFSGSTTISYHLKENSTVIIEIFNAQGIKVDQLINTHQTVGEHKLEWKAGKKAPGLYYYTISTEEESAAITVGKMILVE
ncbi:MAG: PQQ-binding-like beta-propeller repeat protein [Bacteroidetes bacterium]|nr:PQQ-binding-like beta-propeller repeat protein [Bacteroidota bacterium]